MLKQTWNFFNIGIVLKLLNIFWNIYRECFQIETNNWINDKKNVFTANCEKIQFFLLVIDGINHWIHKIIHAKKMRIINFTIERTTISPLHLKHTYLCASIVLILLYVTSNRTKNKQIRWIFYFNFLFLISNSIQTEREKKWYGKEKLCK